MTTPTAPDGAHQRPIRGTCQETHTGAWEDHCVLPRRHPGEPHRDARGHCWSDDPTAPDGDRLPATNSGQETKPDGSWIAEEFQRAQERQTELPAWARPVVTYPAPQQPPAQERETIIEAQQYDTGMLAPPPDADSAGEDAQIASLQRWIADHAAVWETEFAAGPGTVVGLPDAARTAYRWMQSLAASSGVRGGDDQARERLADVLALHQSEPLWLDDSPWCPMCRLPWPCATVRTAGGGQP